MIIGCTAGVYGLFHIGHLNLLKNAEGMCDKGWPAFCLQRPIDDMERP